MNLNLRMTDPFIPDHTASYSRAHVKELCQTVTIFTICHYEIPNTKLPAIPSILTKTIFLALSYVRISYCSYKGDMCAFIFIFYFYEDGVRASLRAPQFHQVPAPPTSPNTWQLYPPRLGQMGRYNLMLFCFHWI